MRPSEALVSPVNFDATATLHRTERIEILDTARGVAILAVALIHCLGAVFTYDRLAWDGWFRDFHTSKAFLLLLPFTGGWAGVAIFFVVSGFCIHLSHRVSKQKDLRTFVVRRFFRIYPPYFVTLLFFTLVFPWPVNFSERAGIWSFVSHVALFHNFDAATVFGINGSFWTIAVEAQLYALYPVLLLVARQRGWRGALIVTALTEFALRAAGAVALCNDWPVPVWVAYNPLGFWFSWTIGAALAEHFLRGTLPRFTRGQILAALGAAVAAYFVKPLSAFAFPAVSVCSAIAIGYALRTHERTSASPTWRFLKDGLGRLGVVSYSFYLIHQPLIFGMLPLVVVWIAPDYQHPLIRFGLAVLLLLPITALAAILYRTIERPSIAVGKRVLARRRNVENREAERPPASTPVETVEA